MTNLNQALMELTESIQGMSLQGEKRTTYKFKKGDIIFKQDEMADRFIILVSGKLNVIRRGVNTSYLVASFEDAAILGEMGLFLDEHKRTGDVEAGSDVEVCVVKYKDFLSYLSIDHRPLLLITKIMTQRLYETTKHAEVVATLSVKERLKHLMASLRSKQDLSRKSDVSIKMSRKEMASRIGCSRELAGRHLAELEVEGYLASVGMKISLLPKLDEISK